MRRRQHGKCPATVRAAERRRVEHIDGRFIPGVGEQVDVVPRAGTQLPIVVRAGPRVAGVVGAEQAPVFGLDHGPHAFGVRGRHGHRRLPHQLRQPLGQPCPCVAGVDGLPDARPGAARPHAPWEPLMIPRRGVQHARVGHVETQFARPSQRIDKEDLFPRLAAVGALVDPAVRARRPPRALRGDVHRVLVARVHDHARDRPRCLEAKVRPALAAIGGLVDTVPLGRRHATHRRLAHSHVNHARVARRHRDRADRSRVEPAVRDVPPVEAGVVRLPDAAPGRAKVVRQQIAGHARNGCDAAAPERTDVAPFQAVEVRRVVRGGARHGRRCRRRRGPRRPAPLRQE